jgi:sulfate transport system permease protein
VTTTVPLCVEILYNEYNFVGALAVASLLVLLALVTLVAQQVVDCRRQPVPPISILRY